jgi:spermidine synthase
MTKTWEYAHNESAGHGRKLLHRLDGPWIFEGSSRFADLDGIVQEVQIGQYTDFGLGLVIDGMSQLTELNELVYTSAMIHVPAVCANSRKSWLIVGGGDGAAAREALCFRDTERVRLVDISSMVITKTQELIPSFWNGAQNDPRLEILVKDAFKVMHEMVSKGEKADIVISTIFMMRTA